MADDIQTTMTEKVKQSPAYPLMTDEATDISNRKHLAYCVKYIDTDSGDVNVDFFKDVQIDDGKSATIFETTMQIVETDLKKDTFMAFGSDGCAAMVGKKTGVATRLKEVKPELVTIHCSNVNYGFPGHR